MKELKGKKIVHEDGHVTYYYYKKKNGRHKKTGRKKKIKKRGRDWNYPWDYKIIRCDFKKQKEYIGVYHDLEEVEFVKNRLLKENENVVFPKKYINNGRNNKDIYEYKSEYLILKKIRNPEIEDNVTKLRNEYGTFVEHKTTSDKWAIYDKFERLEEEKFWVYGYSPKTDRKTFMWIFENLVSNVEDIVIVYLFNNKVILKYSEDFNFVVCKNIEDAIRFYNLLEEKSKKIKNIVFTGFTNGRMRRGKDTIEMIRHKTGWSLAKIFRTNTRA